jgi:hypothetical protein
MEFEGIDRKLWEMTEEYIEKIETENSYPDLYRLQGLIKFWGWLIEQETSVSGILKNDLEDAKVLCGQMSRFLSLRKSLILKGE